MESVTSFWDALSEFIRDVVFGNGFIALGVIVLVALVVVLSRVTGAGQL